TEDGVSDGRIQHLVETYGLLIEAKLLLLAVDARVIRNLHDGVMYALGLDDAQAAKGKRLRPVMCLATAEALGGDIERALPFAAAIEMMHNFALVHDDI